MIRCFKDCGIYDKLDRKDNDEIERIPDYEIPHAEINGAAEFYLESEDDTEDDADEETKCEAAP